MLYRFIVIVLKVLKVLTLLFKLIEHVLPPLLAFRYCASRKLAYYFIGKINSFVTSDGIKCGTQINEIRSVVIEVVIKSVGIYILNKLVNVIYVLFLR